MGNQATLEWRWNNGLKKVHGLWLLYSLTFFTLSHLILKATPWGTIACLQNRYVELLPSDAYECDLIWKSSLCRSSWLRQRSYVIRVGLVRRSLEKEIRGGDSDDKPTARKHQGWLANTRSWGTDKEGSSLRAFRGIMDLLIDWSWTSGHQTCERISVCCFK